MGLPACMSADDVKHSTESCMGCGFYAMFMFSITRM